MADIDIGGTPRKTVTVKLVGIEYKVKPTKTTTALRMGRGIGKDDTDGQYEALMGWVDAAFRKEGAKIRARLDDDDDDLDIEHITELMNKLNEYKTERPTSLSSDSSV